MQTADELTNTLLGELEKKEGTGEYAQTRIKTDERVIARITDGIYRLPGSALRELAANAYDADATLVTIETDAPRFEKIVIRDNGRGMSKATLAHVLHHIGGSAKRTKKGQDLEIVDQADATHSKSGRRLIGKIGIGLFSVAQLTSHFQIISKVRGERFRRVADVLLTTYTEDTLAQSDSNKEFDAGSVTIWSVLAEDTDSQGTDIVLMDLKAQAKELLRSRGVWAAVRDAEEDSEGVTESLRGPSFHIGEIDLQTGDTMSRTGSLPWAPQDAPTERFSKLVQSVVSRTADRATPKLANILDNYLQMLWSLGLALPLRYVCEHPLVRLKPAQTRVFKLANVRRGQAVEQVIPTNTTISEALGLRSVPKESELSFALLVDGIEVLRPISLEGLPEDINYAFKQRLIFIGQCAPDLSRVKEQFRGGDLSFEAYLYWTPKVTPKDHNGVLVRINNSSGTLFDETFMKYQVAEQTRLRQIVAEIFVIDGLDAALNIDRESFNYAHPHYVFMQRWVHEALRQLTNVQKKLTGEMRKDILTSKSAASLSEIQETAKQEWELATTDGLSGPPQIIFQDEDLAASSFDTNTVLLSRGEVFSTQFETKRKTGKAAAEQQDFEQKLVGITQILIAFGVFDEMPKRRQTALIKAIGRVIESGGLK